MDESKSSLVIGLDWLAFNTRKKYLQDSFHLYTS